MIVFTGVIWLLVRILTMVDHNGRSISIFGEGICAFNFDEKDCASDTEPKIIVMTRNKSK